jgi:hypothetical protein
MRADRSCGRDQSARLRPLWTDLKFKLDSLDGSVKYVDRAGTVYEKTGNGDVNV